VSEKPDPLKTVAARDGRRPPEAYRFLFEGLEHTLKKLQRRGHVTGRELSEGLRDKAVEEFGGLARLVLERWGIAKTEDFGEMVFNLVEAGLLGKTEQDRLEDFRNVFDFEDAFPFVTRTAIRKP
jgi:uncharacterized repeat protein (TIGR04138 family)